MITAIEIENFKCFGERVRIELAPITLLFGPNSAGKSTIIEALLYAQEILERSNCDANETKLGGEVVRLGGWRELVHKGMEKAPTRIRLDFVNPMLSRAGSTPASRGSIRYEGFGLETQPLSGWVEIEVAGQADRAGVVLDKFTVGWGSSEIGSLVVDPVSGCVSLVQFSPTHVALQMLLRVACDDFATRSGRYPEELARDPGAQMQVLNGFLQKYLEYLCGASDRNKCQAEAEQEATVGTQSHWVALSRMISEVAASQEVALAKTVGVIVDWHLPWRAEVICDMGLELGFWSLFPRCLKAQYKANPLDQVAAMPVDASSGALPLPYSPLSIRAALSEDYMFLQDDCEDDEPDPDTQTFAVGLDGRAVEVGHSSDFMSDQVARCFGGSFNIVRCALNAMLFLGPLRRIPDRSYEPPRVLDPGTWPTGLAAWDELHLGSNELVASVGRWMSEPDRLGTGYDLRERSYWCLDESSDLVADLQSGAAKVAGRRRVLAALDASPKRREVMLVDQRSGAFMRANQVGTGISQVLPVVVACLVPGKSIVCMAQPELHLHPGVQARLGDLFAEAARSSAERFLLVETHSEHLLLRLLRRIRETAAGEVPDGGPKLTPAQLSVLYLKPGPNGTQVTRLEVNDAGDFEEGWPEGFFEERSQELF